MLGSEQALDNLEIQKKKEKGNQTGDAYVCSTLQPEWETTPGIVGSNPNEKGKKMDKD